jgi:hypothetical protein
MEPLRNAVPTECFLKLRHTFLGQARVRPTEWAQARVRDPVVIPAMLILVALFLI